MEVKIVGTVYALPPLSSPCSLYVAFLRWKRAQILLPAFERLGDAMRGLSDAINRFTKAVKDAGLEDEEWL